MPNFFSPAPIEVAQLPWLTDLSSVTTPYNDKLPPNTTVESLVDAKLLRDEHLKDTGIRIGQVLLGSGLVQPSTYVNIRSGVFDPRIACIYNVGFHFDPSNDLTAPAEVAMVATGRAGSVAVGDIRVKPEFESEYLENFSSFLETQAGAAMDFETAYDLTNADIVPLHENTLYFLPKQTVHSAPRETGPVSRNFFRFKNSDGVKPLY